MGLMNKTLRRLLPAGQAWKAGGNLGLVVEAVADSLETARTFVDNARAESIPKTATTTLPDWFRALGMIYEAGRTTEQRQAQADLAYTSTGGQSLDYLAEQLQREYPNVWIEEDAQDIEGITGEAVAGESVASAYFIYSFTFSVKGDVMAVQDYYRVVAIVERLAPLHLNPEFFIRILNDLDIARSGLAVTGRARTGKAS